MIYLPTLEDNACIVVSSDAIRVYHNEPVLNNDVIYTDYFVNSHYNYNVGIEKIEVVPTCQNVSNFTTDIKYRNDFNDIAVLTAITCIFIFGIPFIILSRFFKRFK